MSLPFAPKIVYPHGGGTTLTLDTPMGYWEPESKGIGGSDLSAAGIPEAFQIRRDELLHVRLRFTESEWSDVRDFIVWAQTNAQTFDFYPDQGSGTNYECYLHAPELREGFRPSRMSDPAFYELTIVLRKADGTVFDVKAWPNV